MIPFRTPGTLTALSSLALLAASAAAAPPKTPDAVLVLGGVTKPARAAVSVDALLAQLVRGEFSAPSAGDVVRRADGTECAWERVALDAQGAVTHDALRGGYAFAAVHSDIEQVVMLDAQGHGMVYVNGEPRVGDIYSTGRTSLPIVLRRGENHLLFHCARGSLRLEWRAPRAEVFLDPRDNTLPTLRGAESIDAWLGILVVNTRADTLRGAKIMSRIGDAPELETLVDVIPPRSIRKAAVRIAAPARQALGELTVDLRLIDGAPGVEPAAEDEQQVRLSVQAPDRPYARTFRSAIDDSVQLYAVRPASGALAAPVTTARPGLVLSLHGAGVQAMDQVRSYAPKAWTHIVAPTNRREFGFDWEDWGRLDALEVLDRAQRELETDPHRVYLTGHSMGGHGSWQLGAHCAPRFAALGPSAGWISFASYAGAAAPGDDPDPVARLLRRAASPSDTLALESNYAPLGIYILHGDADDNVPVAQARQMTSRLKEFHRDFRAFEKPGAGHWWDDSEEPGAACVDWPAMFDLFARRTVPPPEAVREIDFCTVNPRISSAAQWLRVWSQSRPLELSRARLRLDPGLRRVIGTTENIDTLGLDLTWLAGEAPVELELDGQPIVPLVPQSDGWMYARRDAADGTWKLAEKPAAERKGPHRGGPFKDVFDRRFVLVYGTRGSPAENAWALAKARYDAETWWYRGNGTADVVADFVFDPDTERDRNVIVYGNTDTNAAFGALLADSPVSVRRGEVRIGERTITGDDLALLLVRPRPKSDVALVGLVAGSGAAGERLTERLAYFMSGVHYPDFIVLTPRALSDGVAGVRAAGFFANDWGISIADLSIRE
ncbi:MAG: prolyl oligopeptidase family serine peptidase [Phycisphaerae bacterium]